MEKYIRIGGICATCGDKTSRKNIITCKKCDNIRRAAEKPVKEYKREWNRIKKYDIDDNGFDLLWIIAEGKCNICGTLLIIPENTRGQKLNAACIDHDHNTGNLRGLLCNGCNKGLGLFKDDPNILFKAIKWVTKKL